MNHISIDKLKEHHQNNYYFTDLEGEKYDEICRSIEENGIRDPLKVFQEFNGSGESVYTVISGHQRLRIARDLGMDTVPVEVIPDITEQDAEYLLIADNVERRGQAETDPIKKSRIATFLKEYWDINQGVRSDFIDNQRSSKDIADSIGESEWNTRQIMKLNDLIPELQELVSKGKLGTTAGEQLAHLTEDNQRALVAVLGEQIENTTVQQAREYRQEANESEETDTSFCERVQQLEKENELMEKQLEQARESKEIAMSKVEKLEDQEPEVVEKVIDKTDYEKIEQLNNQIETMNDQMEKATTEKEEIEEKLKRQKKRTKEYNKLKKELVVKDEELSALSREQTRMKNRRTILDQASYMARDLGGWVRRIKYYIYERDGGLRGDEDVNRAIESMVKTLEDTLMEVESWRDVKTYNKDKSYDEEPINVDYEIVD